jgi:hypothetical protein
VLQFLDESKMATEEREGTLLALTCFCLAILLLLLTLHHILLVGWVKCLKAAKKALAEERSAH